ncbi:MAG: aminotransferase class V-fold PLP-dependent enzyme [Lachnospiraceae bacterium]
MIYLDNAATTLPKPPQVIAAVCEAMNTYGNPSRGAHEAALESLRCLFKTRTALAQLFGVPDPQWVAFSANATAALNIAISGLRGHVVTTAAEHNSVLRPLYRRGNYTVVSLDSFGRLDLDQLEQAVQADTEAVIMTHASNLTGNVYDIESVGAICHRKGIRLIVDAAQTAGLLPLDMVKSNIAALCFSGHKSLYGPQGTGGLCLDASRYRPAALAVGGSGSDSFAQEHPQVLPDALEAGTQNAHGIAGLLAGITYINSLNGAAFAEADRHARRFIMAIQQMPQAVLYGEVDAPLRTPVVSLNLLGLDSAETADLLSENYGIAVRAGAHCAPLMHEILGTRATGAVRFSFSHFNTDEEVGLAIDALGEIIKDRQ